MDERDPIFRHLTGDAQRPNGGRTGEDQSLAELPPAELSESELSESELCELLEALGQDGDAVRELGLAEPPAEHYESIMDRLPVAEPPLAGSGGGGRRFWPIALAASLAFVAGGLAGFGSASRTADVTITPLTVQAECPTPAPTVAAIPPEDRSEVRFVYVGKPGQIVQVVGGFNAWGENRIALQATAVSGVYQTTVSLPPGEHEYMFVIDGDQFVSDPLADRSRSDGFGRTNSVITI